MPCLYGQQCKRRRKDKIQPNQRMFDAFNSMHATVGIAVVIRLPTVILSARWTIDHMSGPSGPIKELRQTKFMTYCCHGLIAQMPSPPAVQSSSETMNQGILPAMPMEDGHRREKSPLFSITKGSESILTFREKSASVHVFHGRTIQTS